MTALNLLDLLSLFLTFWLTVYLTVVLKVRLITMRHRNEQQC